MINAADRPFTHLLAAFSAANATGQIDSATALLSLNGEVVFTQQIGTGTRPDTLFRIASMTKLVVSAAALSLVEAGRLSLDTAITRWLPDFAPRLPDGRQPAITPRHLLTHTAGLGYALGEAGNGAHRHRGISDGLDARSLSAADNIALIAQAPLLFEPGSAWQYSCATDVLGHLLEVIEGASLDHIIAQRVTGPLDMHDTTFWTAEHNRLSPAHTNGPHGPEPMVDGTIIPFFAGEIVYAPSRALDAGAWRSGGVGLISTARDYLRFLEALRMGGAPILTQASAEALACDAIPGVPTASGPGFGWSLGASVLTDPAQAPVPGHVGAWGWGGVYGSHYFVDPALGLSWVCLTNTALAGMAGPFPDAVRRAVYADLAQAN